MFVTPAQFRDLASGRWRGPIAGALRGLLSVASVGYGWGVARRNRSYDAGRKPVTRPAVPTVSVGNLTVGGVGKTPLVEWLARDARRRGVRTAILSRGYRAGSDGRNDEALELELALPDVPHLQNPNRAESAAVAIEELAAQLLILDDGFQHRQLARDLDLVLIDASQPWGYGRLLPRGLLREPPQSLCRAQAAILTRSDMLDAASRAALAAEVAQLAPGIAWCETIHRPASLCDAAGVEAPLADLVGRRVFAFCGVGNPAGFRHTLEGTGCEIVGWCELRDHYDYGRKDLEMLAALAGERQAEVAICTRKDLVKIRVGQLGGVPLRALKVDLQFTAGEDALATLLEPVFSQAAAVPFPEDDAVGDCTAALD